MRLKKFGDEQKKRSMMPSRLTKDFGKGSIMRLGESRRTESSSHELLVPWLLTFFAVVILFQKVGSSKFGPESGKQPLPPCSSATQKEGGIAALIGAEHALIHLYAAALGVNIDEPLVSTRLRATEIAGKLIDSESVDGRYRLCCCLGPTRRNRWRYRDSHVGLQARMTNQAMRVWSFY